MFPNIRLDKINVVNECITVYVLEQLGWLSIVVNFDKVTKNFSIFSSILIMMN